MRREIKKYRIWKHKGGCPLQHLFFMSYAHFSQRSLFAASVQKATPLILHVHILCMQQSLFTACTEPHPLIYYCCKTPRLLPLQYKREPYSTKLIKQTSSLHKSTFTFTNRFPVPLSLQVATPTNFLFVIVRMHSLGPPTHL